MAPRTVVSQAVDKCRVLVVSASMGGGHDGAGRELLRRLRDQGHHAQMADFLDAFPLRIGWLQRFHADLPDRDTARQALGFDSNERLVLVVAGAWGIGDVNKTFETIIGSGCYTPLVVCGNNEQLRKKLQARDGGHVLGWTDEMPTLMAAADALVQNAGGLTCMEAFAAGLPVVSFEPIAGHGKDNAERMAEAGVAAYAADSDELFPSLDRSPSLAGRPMTANARAIFAGRSCR